MDKPGEARIRPLPTVLANQIAAGEVVERPASVAKELLENSLDAGAKRVEVDVEQGGSRLIRVRDDGMGIHADDLVVALERHATSKIVSLADLERVRSLGFRGEALPSIASVSRLELCSRTAGDDSAWCIDAGGGEGRPQPQPASHPVGTTVVVRDLFYNTPARRKFLRTERTEFRHLEDVVRSQALSRFETAFHLRHNGRQVLAVKAAVGTGERERRVAKLVGAAFMEHALCLEFESTDMRLGGWIAAPGYDRGSTDLQHFFVNGRVVRDNLLRHAVRLAYERLIPGGRHPAYLLYLELPASRLDVNVHPTKHEVRFTDARSVHDFIARSLGTALTATVELPGTVPSEHPGSMATAAPGSAAGGVAGPGALLSAYHGLRGGGPGVAESAAPVGVGSAENRPLGLALGQVAERYLVARRAGALVLVDAGQAGRLLALKSLEASLLAGEVASRPLLVPVSVTLTREQADRMESAAALLERLGFDIRRVAVATVSCRRVPVALAGASPQALLSALATALAGRSAHVEGPGAGDDLSIARDLLADTLEGTDLGKEWCRSPDTMNAMLRQLEDHGLHGDDAWPGLVWALLGTEDMASLLAGRRR
jgi:DNA mismatch repair protein MutL